MKHLRLAIGAAATLAALAGLAAVTLGPGRAAVGWNAGRSRFTLPNQWRISPAGSITDLPGDLPGGIVYVSPTRALINTSGYHDHSLSLVDARTGRLVSTVDLKQAWIGLAWDGRTAYLSGGGSAGTEARPDLRRFRIEDDKLVEEAPLNLPDLGPKQRFVSGVLPTPDGIVVLNVQSDEVFLFGEGGRLTARQKVGYRPYAAALSPDGRTIAVSEWGDQCVDFLEAGTLQPLGRQSLGLHPTALVYDRKGRLFVAEASANTVAIVKGGDVQRVTVSLDLADKVGPTPLSLSLSPDEKTLYVALAGDNAVALVDIAGARAKVKGWIPTENYPTFVAASPDGKMVAITTGKGYYGPNAGAAVKLAGAQVRGKDEGAPFKYVLQLQQGRLALVPSPTPEALAKMTARARENLPLGIHALEISQAEKNSRLAALKKIKHVLYVIKENRTYDQVMGDMKEGNGDPSLTIFGEQVTPNIHDLARKHVLMDNLFTDGECSQVGHQWTDAAYANDYTEKQTMLSYSGRQEVESDRRLTSSPEYLWSLARKAGHKVRVYGEYVDVQEDHDSLENPVIKANPEKWGYSEAWEKVFARRGRDTEKIDVFIKELAQWEKTGDMPALCVMALPDDHTRGFNPGAYSPRAMVACNDQAVGKLVDALSHSRFWKETAVFVIEDDAQAGPDHVEAHRTVGLFISPWTRHGSVDSTHYSTASMLRTMEIILGLKPMTSYDAHATPMLMALAAKPDLAPFSCIPPKIDMNEKNPERSALSARSMKLDWSDIDRVDPGALNRLLWEAYKPGVPYPAGLPGVE